MLWGSNGRSCVNKKIKSCKTKQTDQLTTKQHHCVTNHLVMCFRLLPQRRVELHLINYKRIFSVLSRLRSLVLITVQWVERLFNIWLTVYLRQGLSVPWAPAGRADSMRNRDRRLPTHEHTVVMSHQKTMSNMHSFLNSVIQTLTFVHPPTFPQGSTANHCCYLLNPNHMRSHTHTVSAHCSVSQSHRYLPAGRANSLPSFRIYI